MMRELGAHGARLDGLDTRLDCAVASRNRQFAKLSSDIEEIKKALYVEKGKKTVLGAIALAAAGAVGAAVTKIISG